MGIRETLDYIHNVKWQGVKPGLERTRELLAALGNPEEKLKFVHIAGTNGKGSTAACIASILRRAGYKTGLYTSPYIRCFNERMQVNGALITDEELEDLTNEIRPFADRMKDPPTEFELITALAMKYFVYKNCDIVVLEVGLGGELDSTNVIQTPEVAVITAIGYDHMKELGPTLSDIAKAKAGIIKKDGDVVVYDSLPEVAEVFKRISAERGAKLHRVDFDRIKREDFHLTGVKFYVEPYGEISLPLAGAYQPKNAMTAITAAEVLPGKGYKISNSDIAGGLEAVQWPGRFEVLGYDPAFILDGAHNAQGMEAAADSLRLYFKDRKIVFLIGVMADKDVDAMIQYITPLAEAFYAVRPDNPRAMDARVLAEKLICSGRPVTACDTIGEGVSEAIRSAGKEGVVCALGSLYFSNDVRRSYNLLC